MVLAYPVIALTAPFTHRGSLRILLGETPDPKPREELSSEKQVTAETPPTFLVHTADDPGVPVENSPRSSRRCGKRACPAELHVFEKGRHGGAAWRKPSRRSRPGRSCARPGCGPRPARKEPMSSRMARASGGLTPTAR